MPAPDNLDRTPADDYRRTPTTEDYGRAPPESRTPTGTTEPVPADTRRVGEPARAGGPGEPATYGGAPAAREPGERPTGVTVLAVLAWIGAVFSLLAGLAVFGVGAVGGGAFGGAVAFMGLFLIALGIGYAVTGWGLWTRQRWAWFVALVLAGLSVLSNLVDLVTGGGILGPIIGLLIAGVVIWYLFKPEVQAFFGVNYNTPWKYGRPA